MAKKTAMASVQVMHVKALYDGGALVNLSKKKKKGKEEEKKLAVGLLVVAAKY